MSCVDGDGVLADHTEKAKGPLREVEIVSHLEEAGVKGLISLGQFIAQAKPRLQ